MSLAIENILAPAIEQLGKSLVEAGGQRLDIAVVFTSVDSTLAALKEAGNLANSLGARITLVVPQVVPYPLPLESPPVLALFNENRFRVIARESPVETSVRTYLGRESSRNSDVCSEARLHCDRRRAAEMVANER